MQIPAQRRSELAEFLRARRESLRPEDVGLPSGGRRRTPGLRREEVASLAGVGVTWYTWLEQARDINVSAEVLDAIARALQLDQRERSHLFTLSARIDVDGGCACAKLPVGHDAMLRALEPYPAATFSWRYDVLAYNGPYRVLCTDLDDIPDGERNLLWLMFTHPAWAEFSEDRETALLHMVAKFRGALARNLTDPLAQELISRLRHASTEFVDVWGRNEVGSTDMPIKAMRTSCGRLRVHPQRLLHGEDGAAWTMAYVPADDDALRTMRRLAASAARSPVTVPA